MRKIFLLCTLFTCLQAFSQINYKISVEGLNSGSEYYLIDAIKNRPIKTIKADEQGHATFEGQSAEPIVGAIGIERSRFAETGFFLIDGETALLENLTALTLFRKYGHDQDNERVFFYNNKVEVDFYVPEDRLAIQTSYSISQSDTTFEREVNALKKLPKVMDCERRIILTYDESDSINDEFGTIEILPLWKWILGPY